MRASLVAGACLFFFSQIALAGSQQPCQESDHPSSQPVAAVPADTAYLFTRHAPGYYAPAINIIEAYEVSGVVHRFCLMGGAEVVEVSYGTPDNRMITTWQTLDTMTLRQVSRAEWARTMNAIIAREERSRSTSRPRVARWW